MHLPVGSIVLVPRIRRPVELRGVNANGLCLYGYEIVDGRPDPEALRAFRLSEVVAVQCEEGFRAVLPGVFRQSRPVPGDPEKQ